MMMIVVIYEMWKDPNVGLQNLQILPPKFDVQHWTWLTTAYEKHSFRARVVGTVFVTDPTTLTLSSFFTVSYVLLLIL